jgi:VDE lipocalin domain
MNHRSKNTARGAGSMGMALVALGAAGIAVVSSACGEDVNVQPAAASTTVTGSGTAAGGSGGESTGTAGAGGAEMTTSSSSAGGAGGAGGAGVGGSGTGGVGVGGAGGQGAGGGNPGCPGLGDPCTDCMAIQCSPAYCACYGNQDCSELYQCFGTCAPNDAACQQACYTDHEDGISDATLFGHCAATTCDAACEFGSELTPCQVCLYDDCEPEMNQCIANPDCTAIFACFQGCDPGDPGCPMACFMQYPDGSDDAQSVSQCAQTICAPACQ